jgi:hypothetical protein
MTQHERRNAQGAVLAQKRATCRGKQVAGERFGGWGRGVSMIRRRLAREGRGKPSESRDPLVE